MKEFIAMCLHLTT